MATSIPAAVLISWRNAARSPSPCRGPWRLPSRMRAISTPASKPVTRVPRTALPLGVRQIWKVRGASSTCTHNLVFDDFWGSTPPRAVGFTLGYRGVFKQTTLSCLPYRTFHASLNLVEYPPARHLLDILIFGCMILMPGMPGKACDIESSTELHTVKIEICWQSRVVSLSASVLVAAAPQVLPSKESSGSHMS